MTRTPPDHRSQVFGTPWEGVHGTAMDSARHYGRHWHATYGVGLLDHGAQSSASGRGKVDAYAGDLITTNPGEVHDGRPLGGPSRRWRMVYFDAAVMAGMRGDDTGGHDVELTRRAACSCGSMNGRPCMRAAPPQPKRWPAKSPWPRSAACCSRPTPPRCRCARPAAMCAGCASVLPTTCSMLLRSNSLPRWPASASSRCCAVSRKPTACRRMPGCCCSGFADQSHMTRVFTRHFGFTPGAWQRARVLSSQ